MKYSLGITNKCFIPTNKFHNVDAKFQEEIQHFHSTMENNPLSVSVSDEYSTAFLNYSRNVVQFVYEDSNKHWDSTLMLENRWFELMEIDLILDKVIRNNSFHRLLRLRS